MKKRIVVLFLCMLFLAGNAFALVSRSKWSEDPNYYSELEEDLYELDSTTPYDETEDLYDSDNTYSGGGNFEEDYDVPDQD